MHMALNLRQTDWSFVGPTKMLNMHTVLDEFIHTVPCPTNEPIRNRAPVILHILDARPDRFLFSNITVVFGCMKSANNSESMPETTKELELATMSASRERSATVGISSHEIPPSLFETASQMVFPSLGFVDVKVDRISLIEKFEKTLRTNRSWSMVGAKNGDDESDERMNLPRMKHRRSELL
jgi:hypothetical protein